MFTSYKIIRTMEAKNKKTNKPRLVGDIVTEMLQGWHRNTELSVDLKTLLRNDERLQAGRDYHGILRRDVECEDYYYDEHYTFVETVPPAPRKRNPHVFKGRYITITRQADGSLRPNFRPMKVDEHFSIERFAVGVANELMLALECLIEK